LQEIANHKLTDSGYVLIFLGISQDPQTNNYVMVTNYMKDGSLRQLLSNNYSELNFKVRLEQL
jgi:hypothetical protein